MAGSSPVGSTVADSALDSESERLIQDALENLFKGRTVIAVAHRLATIRSMDRICVVDREIIEQGTHEALVQISDGVYKKLWNLQSGDPDERPGGYLQ